MRDVAAILADDPADGRTLAELGRAVGASERTLSRLFRRDTGMTFPQRRGQLRLQHAMLLLATGSTVTGAGTASGYTNTSAFIAAFRDAFGITPAAYRHEMVLPRTGTVRVLGRRRGRGCAEITLPCLCVSPTIEL